MRGSLYTIVSGRSQHWEGVYSGRRPEELSWYQPDPATSMALIGHAAPGPDDPVVDVGGGASLLVDRLLEAGYTRLTVLDLSVAALAHARARLGSRAAAVEWVEADVTAWTPARRYALWHDRAVLHFLTDPADRRRYAGVLDQALAPRGQVIIGAFAVGGPTRCSGLDIVQYDAPRLLRELGAGFEVVEEMAESHVTPAGRDQAFAWFRLRRP